MNNECTLCPFGCFSNHLEYLTGWGYRIENSWYNSRHLCHKSACMQWWGRECGMDYLMHLWSTNPGHGSALLSSNWVSDVMVWWWCHTSTAFARVQILWCNQCDHAVCDLSPKFTTSNCTHGRSAGRPARRQMHLPEGIALCFTLTLWGLQWTTIVSTSLLHMACPNYCTHVWVPVNMAVI